MKVSIIIVSYNAKNHLQFCLESCLKATNQISSEIIVVDNNSPEKVVEELKPLFPSVDFYDLKNNLGFAKANNFGVEQAKGEYVLILNPDTIVPEDLFEELIPFYEAQKNPGMIGVRLVDADGNFHPESKRNLPTPQNSFSKLFKIGNSKANNYYNVLLEDYQVGKTSILVGAFMFLKRSIYQEIGGFDSRYFMYGEDIDLSYSCELAGYQNFYKGDQIVLHYKGESTRKDKKYFQIFFQAMNLFVDKYYAENLLKRLIMKAGILVKYYLSWIQFLIQKELKAENMPQKNELYWLNHSSEFDQLKVKHVVLSTSKFTFKEILEFIAQNNSSQISFYIHSHLSEKIIGTKGMVF